MPDELQKRVIELVPSEEKDARRSAREEREQAMKAEARRRAQESARAGERQAAQEARQRASRDAQQATALRDRMRSEATQAARNRANRYYRYEMKPGSGASVVVRSDIELKEPEEVAGWDKRYRVRGSIGFEYYDSKGNSFGSRISEFEVLVQGDDRGSVEVIDFTPKS